MDFRMLGPLEVWDDDRALALGGARPRALLAALLVHRNEVVETDRLIDDLWGEKPPATAAKVVQTYVSELRKKLDPDRRLLLTQAGGYRLALRPGQVDAERFEQLADEGRAALAGGDPVRAGAVLREALALWRGRALADCSYETFAQREVARLEELRVATLEERIDADLALGRHGELVGELESLADEHPLRERLRGQLMLALYRSGRQAEALEAYRAARAVLVDELGIEPGPALQRLEKAILVHDPALEPPPPTEPPPPATPQRKPVTVVFAEIAVTARVDPEALRREVDRAALALAGHLERHGAEIEHLGDEVVAGVFGVPVVSENDALRAVQAAAELHTVAPPGVELRVSVNGGEALVGAGSATVGLRLAARPAPGEVLVGPGTEALLRDIAVLRPLPGANAWRLVEVPAGVAAAPRRRGAPLVGRDAELARLQTAFERVTGERVCHLFTVLGPAGIGKSRLAAELRRAVAGTARVLIGRSLPYGDGITFWPLREIVLQALEGAEPEVSALVAGEPDGVAVAQRISAAIGLAELTADREETFWAVRRLLESLAAREPLVLVLDDLHWAEPTFLDLVEHVAAWTRDVPLLLVALARPELLEQRAKWGGGRLDATTMLLEPLSSLESGQLIDHLLAGGLLAAGARKRVTEAAEGNPFFIEQMLALLEDEPARAGAAAVPPTIHALLAARLDRLASPERRLLEHASVLGREFARTDAADLLEGDALGPTLDALVRRDLLRPAPGDAFRFSHQLVRDVAYQSLPMDARAGLHERAAALLESRGSDYDELVGYHLEQASLYRRELGAPSDELGERAAALLGSAGRRAYGRGDVPAATSLLGRGVALLAPDAPTRLALLPALADALRTGGDFEGASRLIEEAIEGARAAGTPALEWRARTARLKVRLRTEREIATEDMLRESDAAIAALSELDDELGLADAWAVRSWIPWLRCRAAETEEAARRSIEHARRAGDDSTEGRSTMNLLGATLFGPTPVPEGIRRCEEVLARPGLERTMLAAIAWRALAGLRAMAGTFEDARAAVAEERQILEALGLTLVAAQACEVWSMVELLAGDPRAAEREIRTGYEATAQADLSSPTLAAILARALFEQGRLDEALALTRTSGEQAAPEDLTTQVQWRGTQAEVLAAQGDAVEAERLAGEAVRLAEETDFLSLRGDALVDLARVLRIAGRGAPSRARLREALRLYDDKGNLAAAAHARAALT